ncbi:hypothetical protein TRAPUB_9598 [Trametes pubescens]|uniref:Uncharacterized protein n=1 Tax=Trametes pubescens TaxID=154538 RepID=A0A1M2W1V2_TRAPU|nr:hypothetical protein TRAPUB_9598 [Trametes pubescens]
MVEVYEAELERMNAAMSAENQTLLNDNRQLSTLIREYEQTLEKAMEKFRAHAHEVQQRELALMRQYEKVIIERETEAVKASLVVNNARSESLVRISRLLRTVLRKMGGEDIQAYEAYAQARARAARGSQSREASGSMIAGPSSDPQQGPQDKGKQREEEVQDEEPLPASDIDRLLSEEEDPEKRVATAEWSLEREVELARLERENEELRALVNGLLPPNAPISRPGTTVPPGAIPPSHIPPPHIPPPQDVSPPQGDHPRGPEDQTPEQQSDEPSPPRIQQRSVGPYGTYKAPSPPRAE